MRAVARKALADIRRRRLQALIVASLATLATVVTALAVTLLTTSSSPYRAAFERQNGGHVVAVFDPRFASADQVAATARGPAVEAHGGPWPVANLPFQARAGKVQLQVVARDDPGGVDALRIARGRWLRRDGEIVLTQSLAEAERVAIGDDVVDVGAAQGVPLRVVGLAFDVDTGPYPNFMVQPAWVSAEQFRTLAPPGPGGTGYLMVYRLRSAGSAAAIRQGMASIRSGLPDGAVTASISYLAIEQFFDLNGSLILTFLVAFGVIALAAAAAVVANVAAGAVLAGYREIGLTRAIGFSPAQSVLGLMLTILAPALAGAVVGTPLGLLLSVPLVQQSFHALGLPAPGVSPLGALAGLLVVLVVALGAVLPAARAGRLSPVRAISVGSAPPSGRTSRLVPLLRRAGLPRWISLGAGDAYARPLRGALTTVAVLVGVATLTFAFGFARSLDRYIGDTGLTVGRGDVVVQRLGDYPDAAVRRTLDDQPETRLVVSYRSDNLDVSGLSDPVPVQSWRGPSDRLGFHVLQGRWFSRPGEVVAGPAFLKLTRLRVGDSFDASLAGHRSRLLVVGSYFTTNGLGVTLAMDWSTLQGFDPTLEPEAYQVILERGSDVSSYVGRVAASSPSQLEVADLRQVVAQQLAPTRSSVDAILVVLVAVLALIAGLGVFNAVLLTTRERVRDTAVLRTLGMGPGRTVAMVAASGGLIGLLGGALGAPAGVLAYLGVLGLVGNLLGSPFAGSSLDAYSAVSLATLAATGVLVAAMAALLPARWAASSRAAEILRAE